ncbi:MAG TPA: pilus assembly protein N-terminal domain-containing protein [Terracidiphilus sp.]|jgi:pilus assembly protein CpaC|nr:pilus assembly protein N-terminal domain-containing protein [Terracidiphilus sp.]
MWFVLGAGQNLLAQAAPASPAAGTAFQDSTNDLSLTVGKTVLVDTAQPIARVALGTSEVAQATAVSPTEIMVNGKAAGETSLIIWDIHGGRQFFNVTVRAVATVSIESMEAVRRELRMELPGQTVKISFDNNTLFLRGRVKDLLSSERAVKIASTVGKVVNLLDVDVPPTEPQILLKVRFASVDRSLVKQLGINLFNLGAGNFVGGVSTGQFSPPTISGSSSASSGSSFGSGGASAAFSNELNILGFYPGLGIGASLEAMQSRGLVEVLAEPNLMAANGKEASFLAGGEFPYPVVQGTSAGGSTAVTIEFKEYGIRLNFIPTIMPQGTIRLQVAPEVSALDFTNAVTLSGFTVPAITSRKVNTEVDLKDGQSFVIGGLLDNTETETFQKIPFLGDIPILGKFFQSISRTRNNSELIVIVTPEVVAPIPAGQELPQLKYPVQFLPPNSNISMHQPDAKTAENTMAPAPTSIPVEKLLESMRPEKPLIIESSTGGFGVGGTPLNSGTGVSSGGASSGTQ